MSHYPDGQEPWAPLLLYCFFDQEGVGREVGPRAEKNYFAENAANMCVPRSHRGKGTGQKVGME